MNLSDVKERSIEFDSLVVLPGLALCIMALIVCNGTRRYLAVLCGFSFFATLVSIEISTSVSEVFVEPSFLDSFSKDGVWVVNPNYHPDLFQLLCMIAVVAAAFVIAVHQLWRGRGWVGRGFLIVACSALSAVAVWVWTVGSLYGYRSLVGG